MLSDNDEDLLTGNFIADHIKGKSYTHFSPGVQKGILLHREIDTFTDSHAVVLQSKERLFPKYHHYSSVIVDMFYDHILARQWAEYSDVELKDFTANCYKILLFRKELPVKATFMLGYMSEQDWLANYRTEEGINRSLTGLSNRTNFESNMQYASEDLKKDYNLYSKEFELFFPQLIQHCSDWLRGSSL